MGATSSRIRVPSYRKHKPSKQAVVTIRGRTHYLGKYGTKESRQRYARLISDYLEELGHEVPARVVAARMTASAKRDLTVVEACARYLAHVQSRYAKAEQAHVKGMLSIVVGLYENELAAAVGPAELREIRRTMVEKGWSRTYVNDQVARVRRMYKWLAAEPLIPITTYQSLLVVSGLRRGEEGVRETQPVRPIEDSVVDQTLPHLPEVVADMVRLQRLTGMRPAEVCMIRPCDVDRSAEHSDVWLYRPATHKTEHHGKDRVIFVGPQAQAILLRYIARDAGTYCFRPSDSEVKRRAAISAKASGRGCVRAGDRYVVATYRRAIHRACDKAFPHPEQDKIGEQALEQWRSQHRWSPNRLRHAAATEIRRRFGLEAAQVTLGHSQANVTQIYAERDMSLGVDVARKIG